MANLVSDLIQQAFESINVVQPGELISTGAGSLQANGFLMLNELLNSLSAERYSVFTKVLQSFALIAGTTSYTLGNGGTFPTTSGLRAQRVESWSASSGGFRSGGAILAFPEFQAASANPLGLSSVLPKDVGADEAFPLINVRVSPTPAVSPGTLELAYWTPVAQFATVGDAITLPPGWFQMLYSNLGITMYPKYARVGGLSPELAALAQSSKQALIGQNAPTPQAGQ